MERLFDYNITPNLSNLDKIGKKVIINTINPHSYCVAKKDNNFKRALQESDVLLPDGIGIVLAIKLLKKKTINKIAGADLHRFLLEKANKKFLKVFYLGSSNHTLVKIREHLIKEYPNIQTGFYSPPFKTSFSDQEDKKMINEVNNFHPDILFVGMTAPKQEKWVNNHKDKLNVSIISSIGAVFDFYAGTVKRAPKWMIKIGLEWLHRSLKNPQKLGIRNLKSNPEFIFDILKEKIRTR